MKTKYMVRLKRTKNDLGNFSWNHTTSVLSNFSPDICNSTVISRFALFQVTRLALYIFVANFWDKFLLGVCKITKLYDNSQSSIFFLVSGENFVDNVKELSRYFTLNGEDMKNSGEQRGGREEASLDLANRFLVSYNRLLRAVNHATGF